MPWQSLGFPSRQGNGSIIATSSADGTVRLWDSESGTEVRTIFVSRDAVRAIDFSHQGKTLAAVSEDGKLVFMDVGSGLILRQFKVAQGAQAVALDFHDRLVAVGYKARLDL
jgi:WD40 repeat protein